MEGGGHVGICPPVGKAQHAHALNLAAHPHAVAAQNALVGVTDDGRGGIVNGLELFIVLKANLPHPHLVGQILKDALAGLHAGGAVPAVSSQQQLHNQLAMAAQPLGVGINNHAVPGFLGAGGEALPPVVFHGTQAAGTEGTQLTVVAQSGHIDARLADDG